MNFGSIHVDLSCINDITNELDIEKFKAHPLYSDYKDAKFILEDGKYIVVNSKFISTDGQVAKFSNKQICPLFIDDILLVMSDLPNGRALSKTFIVNANDRYTLNQRIGGITVKNKEECMKKFYFFIHIVF